MKNNYFPQGGSSYSTALGRGTQQAVSAESNMGNSSCTNLKQSSSSTNFFPITSFRSFDIGDPTVVLNKLKEFNQKYFDSNGRVDDSQLEEMVKMCFAPPTDPNAFDVLFKLLDWPDGKYYSLRQDNSHYPFLFRDDFLALLLLFRK